LKGVSELPKRVNAAKRVARSRARRAARARLEIAPLARIAFPARFRALSRRFARAIASARRR
jgi:hypothetical protein